MFKKISNSWALLKASAAVLSADKELIVFPIVSTIAVLIVTATFALPMLFAGFVDSLIKGDSQILGLYHRLFLLRCPVFCHHLRELRPGGCGDDSFARGGSDGARWVPHCL